MVMERLSSICVDIRATTRIAFAKAGRTFAGTREGIGQSKHPYNREVDWLEIHPARHESDGRRD